MLELSQEASDELWRTVVDLIAAHPARLAEGRATPEALDAAAVRALVEGFDLEQPLPPAQAVQRVAEGLYRHQVHPPHPRYFGLFNPAATEAGVAGDALAAVFNPNVAAWSHSPFATEVEQRLIREIGGLFGWPPEIVEGTFTAGGMEANHSAVLAALTEKFPAFRGQGLRGLTADPVFYVSAECHHSFHRAARMCGLGTVGVRPVRADESLRLDPAELERRIEADRGQGRAPFLVVGTAGTTNAGAVDPLEEIGAIARRHGLWFHVDAAWAGAAALVPELRALLAGVERADSLTVDAHKWFSAPMGAGVFLTQRKGSLEKAFSEQNPYMPREAGAAAGVDQYQRGLQWSRRFFGLKLWLSLLLHGWEGYRQAVRRMTELGERLETGLRERGWRILNRTPLPIVCFVPADTDDPAALEAIRDQVFRSGEAWISTTRLRGDQPALRACVTNFRTSEADIDRLLDSLDAARRQKPLDAGTAAVVK
ncbi:MAG: aminotransferase class V-fold PLP-dependent enzyme [Acidobacteria bacterium]|nr:aminotransferase class V-fold PLP-dependent enzyme [Acidobacteriota bacterium]